MRGFWGGGEAGYRFIGIYHDGSEFAGWVPVAYASVESAARQPAVWLEVDGGDRVGMAIEPRRWQPDNVEIAE